MAQNVRDFEMAYFQIGSKSRSRGKLPRFQKNSFRDIECFEFWTISKFEVWKSEPSRNWDFEPIWKWAISKSQAYAFTWQHLIRWLLKPPQGGNDPPTLRFIETKNQIFEDKNKCVRLFSEIMIHSKCQEIIISCKNHFWLKITQCQFQIHYLSKLVRLAGLSHYSNTRFQLAYHSR